MTVAPAEARAREDWVPAAMRAIETYWLFWFLQSHGVTSWEVDIIDITHARSVTGTCGKNNPGADLPRSSRSTSTVPTTAELTSPARSSGPVPAVLL